MIQLELDDIVFYNTAPRLRSGLFLNLSNTIQEALKYNLNELYLSAERIRYENSFTGQVIYLEHILNDKFDFSQRRIKIKTPDLGSIVYLYNKLEDNEATFFFNKTENEPPFYFQNNIEVESLFIVVVPTGLLSSFTELRYWIEKYKLQGKKYIIIEQ